MNVPILLMAGIGCGTNITAMFHIGICGIPLPEKEVPSPFPHTTASKKESSRSKQTKKYFWYLRTAPNNIPMQKPMALEFIGME